MEYLSEEQIEQLQKEVKKCFNPYFNGIPFGS